MQLLCRALHLGLDPECSSATTAGQVEGAMSASCLHPYIHLCLQRLRGTEIQVRLGQHCMQGIAYRGSAAQQQVRIGWFCAVAVQIRHTCKALHAAAYLG